MLYENKYQDYYENYQLNDNVSSWELSESDKDKLNMTIFIVDNNCSIRNCCKEFCISKSQLHRDIHKKIKSISLELYQCVIRQLSTNKRRYFR